MPHSTTDAIQVIAAGQEVRDLVRAAQSRGQRVGFVPTMGALHEGHLSLVDAARAESDLVVASIFVNPTQFGPNEDLQKYPRPLSRDLELLQSRGCRVAFVPEVGEMYPPEFDTFIDVGRVAEPLEGAIRPGHFRGVATVVHKLFQLVPAEMAYFGQKDYQQLLVVRRMVADLNLPIAVRVCPIVREADGLALSSRNAYLSHDERCRAAALHQSLQAAQAGFDRGERDADAIRRQMLALLAEAGIDEVQYIAFLRDGTMDEVLRLDGPTVVAVAARVGSTRLIDNLRLEFDG
jgi:pantoate--beta-alanine ligase